MSWQGRKATGKNERRSPPPALMTPEDSAWRQRMDEAPDSEQARAVGIPGPWGVYKDESKSECLQACQFHCSERSLRLSISFLRFIVETLSFLNVLLQLVNFSQREPPLEAGMKLR